jgi:hypothetical protein
VVSRPIVPDAAASEVQTWSLRVSGWSAAAARAISPLGEVIAVPDTALDGAALLISLPPSRTLEEASAALVAAGATVRATALVGGHATRYTI